MANVDFRHIQTILGNLSNQIMNYQKSAYEFFDTYQNGPGYNETGEDEADKITWKATRLGKVPYYYEHMGMLVHIQKLQEDFAKWQAKNPEGNITEANAAEIRNIITGVSSLADYGMKNIYKLNDKDLQAKIVNNPNKPFTGTEYIERVNGDLKDILIAKTNTMWTIEGNMYIAMDRLKKDKIIANTLSDINALALAPQKQTELEVPDNVQKELAEISGNSIIQLSNGAAEVASAIHNSASDDPYAVAFLTVVTNIQINAANTSLSDPKDTNGADLITNLLVFKEAVEDPNRGLLAPDYKPTSEAMDKLVKWYKGINVDKIVLGLRKDLINTRVESDIKEAARIAAKEQERIRKEQEEKDRIQREKEEQERARKEQEEKDRIQREKEEQEKARKEQEEKDRIQREKEEQERIRREKEEQEKIDREDEEPLPEIEETEESLRLKRMWDYDEYDSENEEEKENSEESKNEINNNDSSKAVTQPNEMNIAKDIVKEVGSESKIKSFDDEASEFSKKVSVIKTKIVAFYEANQAKKAKPKESSMHKALDAAEDFIETLKEEKKEYTKDEQADLIGKMTLVDQFIKQSVREDYQNSKLSKDSVEGTQKVEFVDKAAQMKEEFKLGGVYTSLSGPDAEKSLDYMIYDLRKTVGEPPERLVKASIDKMNSHIEEMKPADTNRLEFERRNAGRDANKYSFKLDGPKDVYKTELTAEEKAQISKSEYVKPANYDAVMGKNDASLTELLQLEEDMSSKVYVEELKDAAVQNGISAVEQSTDKIVKETFNLKTGLRDRICDNFFDEVVRLRDELKNTIGTFQRNSSGFNHLMSAMDAFADNKGMNLDMNKNGRTSLDTIMKDINKAAKEYFDQHSGNAKLTDTMNKRLRIISRINDLQYMAKNEIDPDSYEGRNRRLAEKLVNAQFVKINATSKVRFNPEQMTKYINAMLENQDFKKYVRTQILEKGDKNIERYKDSTMDCLKKNGQKLLKEFQVAIDPKILNRDLSNAVESLEDDKEPVDLDDSLANIDPNRDPDNRPEEYVKIDNEAEAQAEGVEAN